MEHDDVLEDLLTWSGMPETTSSTKKEETSFDKLKRSCSDNSNNSNKKNGLQQSAIPINIRSNSVPPPSLSLSHAEALASSSNRFSKASSWMKETKSTNLIAAPRASSVMLPSEATTTTMERRSRDVSAHDSTFSALSTQDYLPIPSDVSEKLFDYQIDGINWLYKRHCYARACLLADEMGLGKTVQVCVLLRCLYSVHAINSTLIVVPPTLVNMWIESLQEWGQFVSECITLNRNKTNQFTELKKISNNFYHQHNTTKNVTNSVNDNNSNNSSELAQVTIIHGQVKSKRQALWRKLEYFTRPYIILTSYGALRQDVHCIPGKLMFDYLILDEAHLIKDASTHSFKSVMELSARHKIALTGTPFMNSFEDMWSIFKFLDGSILNHERTSFKHINTTLLQGNEKDASHTQKKQAATELRKLQDAIAPYMLRREKASLQHAIQAKKHEMVVWVKLSDTQRTQYETFLESKEVMLFTQSSKLSSVESSLEEEQENEYSTFRSDNVIEQHTSHIKKSINNNKNNNKLEICHCANGSPLLLLTTLTQICNHPWLGLTEAGFRAASAEPFEPLPLVSCNETELDHDYHQSINNNDEQLSSNDNFITGHDEHYTTIKSNEEDVCATEMHDWNAWMGDIWSGSKLSVALIIITRALNDQRRVLVFSRSKRLLDMMSILLKLYYIPFCRLDGDVLPEQRQELVNNFNNTDQASISNERYHRINNNVCEINGQVNVMNRSTSYLVCLLTTQVGGLGLTFTSASCVIMLDPSWNPSVDQQAIDRVHRIGQLHAEVYIFRLITCGTVEEKMYRNQIFKSIAAQQATSFQLQPSYSKEFNSTEAIKSHNCFTEEEKRSKYIQCYFTHIQLRGMFVAGSFDKSETATQLSILHPHLLIDARAKSYIRHISEVCAISDHSSVLFTATPTEAKTSTTPTTVEMVTKNSHPECIEEDENNQKNQFAIENSATMENDTTSITSIVDVNDSNNTQQDNSYINITKNNVCAYEFEKELEKEEQVESYSIHHYDGKTSTKRPRSSSTCISSLSSETEIVHETPSELISIDCHNDDDDDDNNNNNQSETNILNNDDNSCRITKSSAHIQDECVVNVTQTIQDDILSCDANESFALSTNSSILFDECVEE